MGNMGRGNKLAQRRRRAERKRALYLEPSLVRPERVEIERRADAWELARQRQDAINRVAAIGLLGVVGAGIVAAFLSVFGAL